jgi:phospholipid N-methyltransferase
MLRALKQRATFIKQFTTRFETTGSLVPSSRFLAKSVTRYLSERKESPIRVLECGPGTGAFTNRIVRLLHPGDTYHLVELNEPFVQTLKRRFEEEPRWQAVADTAQIFETPLQDFQPTEKYDFIISGLPHVNFSPALLEQMTAAYFRMLKPGGMCSYFEYMHLLRIRKSISLRGARQRMHKVNSILQNFCSQYRIRRDSVWRNVPPAWVQHLSNPGGE